MNLGARNEIFTTKKLRGIYKPSTSQTVTAIETATLKTANIDFDSKCNECKMHTFQTQILAK